MPVEAPLQDLVDRYYGRIRRAAALLTGCTWDADDLTQETFARAAESWHRFSGRGDTFTWLYGILLNTDRSRRRRILRWLQCHTGLTVTWRDAQTNEEPADETDFIWKQVAELSPLMRQAITMRFGEAWSYSQIAEMCLCPEATARGRVSRALGQLRKRLRQSGALEESFMIAFEKQAASG